MKLLLPKPLKHKSTIGLICPAGGFEDYKSINLVNRYLKNCGYKVKIGKSIVLKVSKNNYKYLSGNDKSRLADLVNFYNLSEVDAIFCLRGGYGSSRLLDLIDFKQFIKKSPKLIVGFSDITILSLALYSQSNLVTVHGPMLGVSLLKNNATLKSKTTANLFWKLLVSPGLNFFYSNKKEGFSIYPGKTSGVMLGGNLTAVCSLLGTKYSPNYKNSILLLEDVNEEPYKIDRMLTQLDQAGVFKQVKGVVFSSFAKCKFRNDKEILLLLKDKLSRYRKPSIYKFPIGHVVNNYPVPIGLKVSLDADNLTLAR